MTTSHLVLPFIYGRPVQANEFVSREVELRTIYNRLRNGESTAVVGEPHSGKTSLLLHITHPSTQNIHLSKDSYNYVFSFLDLHIIGNDYAPNEFWDEVLIPLNELKDDSKLLKLTKDAAKGHFSPRSLERLFVHLAGANMRLVVLLDEFERLLNHPNFSDPSFFALLRSLGSRTGGLAFVLASRLSVAEMNERGRNLLDIGSPFFNYLIELRLRPFDQAGVELLLDRAGDQFTIEEKRFIKRVAGSTPFLLQAMAATFLETSGENRFVRAAESFYERVSFHFDDVWNFMDDRTRTAAVIVSLMDLGGRAWGKDFAFAEIESTNIFKAELRNLADLGMVEQVPNEWNLDSERFLLWQGERWTVSAQAFTWWVRDVVLTDVRSVPMYTEWLSNKRYDFLLTQEQWDRLTNRVRNAPTWSTHGISGPARALLAELMRQKP